MELKINPHDLILIGENSFDFPRRFFIQPREQNVLMSRERDTGMQTPHNFAKSGSVFHVLSVADPPHGNEHAEETSTITL